MKYMLLMSNTKAMGEEMIAKATQAYLKAIVTHMRNFAAEIDDAGILVSTMGLAFPDEAKLVTAGAHGEPVTDGIFAESKEFLAGFWIVDVESAEEAYRVAARVSAGPFGSIPIEVRRIMESAPEEWTK
jgi:hypothetical protein